MKKMSWIKKTLLALAALLVILVIAYLSYARFVHNPKIVEQLRTEPEGTYAGRAMLIQLPNGHVLPVNYLREGDLVFVGVDGRWWREFVGSGIEVKIEIRGETLAGTATVVLDDPAYTDEIFARLRPAAPEWLPDWLNGKLVVIKLQD